MACSYQSPVNARQINLASISGNLLKFLTHKSAEGEALQILKDVSKMHLHEKPVQSQHISIQMADRAAILCIE
ncbi:6684_t:CDS:2 [Entrophospora sp. SA101]|nr:6684_t:CDS:2 [Entrophospora sp. SA101]